MSIREGSGIMTTSEQIRVLCVRSGVSLSELARRINQSPQNFNAKLKRNTITQDELNKIAEALGVTYEQYFVLANGEQVK
jgi:transcriptional regulator with XRE-family HTH domain